MNSGYMILVINVDIFSNYKFISMHYFSSKSKSVKIEINQESKNKLLKSDPQ